MVPYENYQDGDLFVTRSGHDRGNSSHLEVDEKERDTNSDATDIQDKKEAEVFDSDSVSQ